MAKIGIKKNPALKGACISITYGELCFVLQHEAQQLTVYSSSCL